MTDYDKNLLFGKVNIVGLDKETATKDMLAVNSDHWFWDEYRTCRVISLLDVPYNFKPDYVKRNSNPSNTDKDFVWQWKSYTPPIIIDWFEKSVFPWMGSKAGIIALLTEPGCEIKPHIDCGKLEIGSCQHKFRYVLQGKTNSLYFVTKNGRVPAPLIEDPYIVDGTWPHGMTNNHSDFKLTLAAGNPWIGKKYHDDVDILLTRNKEDLPDHLFNFFRN